MSPCRITNLICDNYIDVGCYEIDNGCNGRHCQHNPEKCKFAAQYNLNIVHKCGYEFSTLTHLPDMCPGCDEKINSEGNIPFHNCI